MTNTDKLAIIDMGTNTFHLLIVSKSDNQLGFREVYRERHYVLLAEGGISTISENSILRVKKAIDAFSHALKDHDNIELQIVGTEALRVASNGNVVNDYAIKRLGTSPFIISGGREAELIYKGNSLIASNDHSPYLIMDIGGGSTEFIFADNTGILFSKSYPLGVTKMYNTFNDTDPISEQAITKIESHMVELLSDLSMIMKSHNLKTLIGASGSFEVLSQVLHGDIPKDGLVNVAIQDFDDLATRAIAATIEERRSINGIPETRVKLIQVAFIMMRKVIDMYTPDQIGVSPFAIKEGLISEWLSDSMSES